MAAAMEEALQALRAQERAMKARAEASERLSEEIIASMTSGLLVVTEHREVRTLNPAGRRLLGLAARADPGSCARCCARAAAGRDRRGVRVDRPRHRPAGRAAVGRSDRAPRTSASPFRPCAARRSGARRDLPVHRPQEVVELEEQCA